MEEKSVSPELPLELRGFPDSFDAANARVLRYMPFKRFLSMIQFQAVWFSRLGELQDKFEGTDPEGTRAFFLKLAENPAAVEKCKTFGLWDFMKANAENSHSGGDGARIGSVINCWFIGHDESFGMWKDFGDGGKGVAVRSTIDQLATAFLIPGDFRLLSRVGRVNYVDFRSYKCLNRNDTFEVSWLKDKFFEHENEVRILTLNNCLSCYLDEHGRPLWRPGRPRFIPNLKGFNVPCDLAGLINGVIAGPNMLPGDRDLLKKIVDSQGKPVNVEFSKIAPWH